MPNRGENQSYLIESKEKMNSLNNKFLNWRFITIAALLLFAVACLAPTMASAAEDIAASRERLCGSNSDCLTVVVVEEILIEDNAAADESSVGNEDPEVIAALALQDAKDAERGINKQNKKVKRVPRSFLKIDRLNFKTDTVVKLVKNMPEWFGPRPAKFVFRGKEVAISKRLSRFNPRLNEKIVMIAADEVHDEKEIIVPKEGGGGSAKTSNNNINGDL